MAQTVSYNDFLSIIDINVSRYIDCNYKAITKLEISEARKYYELSKSYDFVPISKNIIAYTYDLYNIESLYNTQCYKMFIIKVNENYIIELYQFTERHDDSIVCIKILNKVCQSMDEILTAIKSMTYIDSTNILKNIENILLF